MPQLIISTVADRRFLLCSGPTVLAAEFDKFPDSHVMGELCYREYRGGKVTALARWDVSISTKDAIPSNPEIDVYLIGDAVDIKCRHTECKNKKRWEIGRAAVKQIIRNYVPE